MMRMASAQKKKMATDCWEKENLYVGFPEKARKRKTSEKAAMGRRRMREYKSKFFHLGSDKYQVFDR